MRSTLRLQRQSLGNLTVVPSWTQANEIYLGNVKGILLRRGLIPGYEVHATNTRIIGVKNSLLNSPFLGLRGFPSLGEVLGDQWFRSQNSAMLKELERRKNFYARAEEIQTIEFKESRLLRGGCFTIILKSEDLKNNLTVRVYGEKQFSRLRELARTFAMLNPKVVLKDKPEHYQFWVYELHSPLV